MKLKVKATVEFEVNTTTNNSDFVAKMIRNAIDSCFSSSENIKVVVKTKEIKK